MGLSMVPPGVAGKSADTRNARPARWFLALGNSPPRNAGSSDECKQLPLARPPNLLGWLVFPQADVNRVSQEIVGRPGQIGDLGDKLGLDAMDP
jgi:hypothetical protein